MYSTNYNYDILISNYLCQSRNSGVTAKGRMSFQGDTLYSYKSKLFQRIVPNTYILDTATASYSVTTAKHTSRILRAMPNDAVIYRTYIDGPIQQNIAIYVVDIKYLISKFTRARNTKPQWRKQIHKSYAELQSYMEFYNVDKRTIGYRLFKQLFVIMFEAKVL